MHNSQQTSEHLYIRDLKYKSVSTERSLKDVHNISKLKAWVSEWTEFNPLKCSGIRWLHLKVFNTIQV